MNDKLQKAYAPAKQSFKNAGFDLDQISSNMMELMVNGQYNAGLGFNEITGGTKAFEEGNWALIEQAYKNGDISKERFEHYIKLLRRERLYQQRYGINRKRHQ